MTGATHLLSVCDVLCAVCHRIRTFENKDNLFGSDRATHAPRTSKRSPSFYKRQVFKKNRAKEIINTAKVDKPCTDCGISFSVVAMDFDHIEDKRFALSYLRRHGPTITSLLREIDKCELVCANCHRERTWQRQQHDQFRQRLLWILHLYIGKIFFR
jgi:5-methylcytosine-specific restriction endonuclease McrA